MILGETFRTSCLETGNSASGLITRFASYASSKSRNCRRANNSLDPTAGGVTRGFSAFLTRCGSAWAFGGTGHLTMNDRLTASRVREWVGKSARFFSVVSVPPWLFFSPQRYGGHGKIRGSLIAADPRRRGQSRLFCRQAVSSPLRRVPPNHQVETNRCQASRLRSWPVTGDSFPVCHGALTAAVAHPGR